VVVLVALATGLLRIAGRVALALVLSVFFLAYAALGLAVTPVVAFALAVAAVPRLLLRLGAFARPRLRGELARPHPPLVTAVRSHSRPRPTPRS